jgi:hypothetical protein
MFYNYFVQKKRGGEVFTAALLSHCRDIESQILPSFPLLFFGSKPSFAWRSTLSAKELLQQGVVWRVGDGQSIKVWGDRGFLRLLLSLDKLHHGCFLKVLQWQPS